VDVVIYGTVRSDYVCIFNEMAVFVCVCGAAVENTGHASFSVEEELFNNSVAVIQSRRQPFYPQLIHRRDCLFP